MIDSHDMLQGAALGAFSVAFFVLLSALLYYHQMRPHLRSCGNNAATKAVVLTLALLSGLNLVGAAWFAMTFMFRFAAALGTPAVVAGPVGNTLLNYVIAYAILAAPAGGLIYTLHGFEREQAKKRRA